jgi:hypothetical protein
MRSLRDKPYFMGAEPEDASMFAFAAGILCRDFRSPVRELAERHDLRRYVGRITARFDLDYAEIAAA